MARIPISFLPPAAALTGDELLPAVQGGATVAASLADVWGGAAGAAESAASAAAFAAERASEAAASAAAVSTAELDRARAAGAAIGYRDVYDQLFVVVDAAGRVGMALDDRGSLSVGALALVPPGGATRDVHEEVFWVADSLGRAPLLCGPDGWLRLAAGRLLLRVQPVPSRDVLDAVPVVADALGRVALGLDHQGRLIGQLADGSIADAQRRAYLPPGALRGDLRGFNVRRAAGGRLIATVSDRDRSFDVIQRTDNFQVTAVVDDARPIELILWQGQSNAGAGGDGATSMMAALYPHHCLQLDYAPQTYGNAVLSPALLKDFKPYANPAGGLYAATPMLAALERWDRDAGRASPGRLAHSCWYGGEPLSTFVEGTDSWDNLLTVATRAAAIAPAYGRTAECRAIVWVQGEAGPTSYATPFGAYIDAVVPAVQAATGQAAAPAFVYVQINNGDTTNARLQVAVDQYTVAKARAGAGVYLAGPMYQCPLYDVIHPGEIGRIIQGEMVAACYERVVAGTGWNPLWPTSVVRSGANIDVTFALPPGGGALAFDTDWILAATSYGFVYTDDSGSPPAISSVTITGANTVRVTLASAPTGSGKLLRYALGQDAIDDTWDAARGQLYSPTTRESAAYRLGYPVPRYIRHYCVKFEEALT